MCGWCKKFLMEIAAEYDICINSLEVMPDHVHLLVSAPPRLAPSRIAQILKSRSAKAMFERFPELRKHYYGHELWIDGYMIRSLGVKLTADDIKKYIKEQRQGALF